MWMVKYVILFIASWGTKNIGMPVARIFVEEVSSVPYPCHKMTQNAWHWHVNAITSTVVRDPRKMLTQRFDEYIHWKRSWFRIGLLGAAITEEHTKRKKEPKVDPCNGKVQHNYVLSHTMGESKVHNEPPTVQSYESLRNGSSRCPLQSDSIVQFCIDFGFVTVVQLE